MEVFTFQYVSINTRISIKGHGAVIHLHSNMFLLIPIRPDAQSHTTSLFTFQYVSINTALVILSFCEVIYLHSNMFLLIPKV